MDTKPATSTATRQTARVGAEQVAKEAPPAATQPKGANRFAASLSEPSAKQQPTQTQAGTPAAVPNTLQLPITPPPAIRPVDPNLSNLLVDRTMRAEQLAAGQAIETMLRTHESTGAGRSRLEEPADVPARA